MAGTSHGCLRGRCRLFLGAHLLTSVAHLYLLAMYWLTPEAAVETVRATPFFTGRTKSGATRAVLTRMWLRRWPMSRAPIMLMPLRSADWRPRALSSKARAPSNEARRLGFDLHGWHGAYTENIKRTLNFPNMKSDNQLNFDASRKRILAGPYRRGVTIFENSQEYFGASRFGSDSLEIMRRAIHWSYNTRSLKASVRGSRR